MPDSIGIPPTYRSDVLATRLPRPAHCLTDFNVCYVIPDTNHKHDPYKLVCFFAYNKQLVRFRSHSALAIAGIA